MKNLFTEGFSAMDIAEPLTSFDADKPADQLKKFMAKKKLSVIGIREQGVVVGYAEPTDLRSGTCGDCAHNVGGRQILTETSSLQEVIRVLDEHNFCFLSVLGNFGAYVSRSELGKPPVRMWLFGMITIIEMYLTHLVQHQYPGGAWQEELSEQRLEKAKSLQKERERRKEMVKLIDCLQLSEKAQILIKDPEIRLDMGVDSIREGKRRIKDLESLRNNLAHGQDIVSYNWPAITELSGRLEKIISRI